MNSKFLVSFALLIAVGYVGANNFYSYNGHGIKELNADTFYNNIYNHTTARDYTYVVKFYKNGSEISTRYIETYTKLADQTEQWKTVVRFAAVNCGDQTNDQLCDRHGFTFLPILKYFRLQDSKNSSYLGEKMMVLFNPQAMTEQLSTLIAEDYWKNDYPNWPKFNEFPEITNNTDEVWQYDDKCVTKILFVVDSFNNTNSMTKFIRISNSVGRQLPVRRIQKTHELARLIDPLDLQFVTSMMISRPVPKDKECEAIYRNNARLTYETVLRMNGMFFDQRVVENSKGNNTIRYSVPI